MRRFSPKKDPGFFEKSPWAQFGNLQGSCETCKHTAASFVLEKTLMNKCGVRTSLFRSMRLCCRMFWWRMCWRRAILHIFSCFPRVIEDATSLHAARKTNGAFVSYYDTTQEDWYFFFAVACHRQAAPELCHMSSPKLLLLSVFCVLSSPCLAHHHAGGITWHQDVAASEQCVPAPFYAARFAYYTTYIMLFTPLSCLCVCESTFFRNLLAFRWKHYNYNTTTPRCRTSPFPF